MARLFADLPEAIDNTVEIALRCSYYPKNRNPILPRFTGGDVADANAAVKAEADELARQAHAGRSRRRGANGRRVQVAVGEGRLRGDRNHRGGTAHQHHRSKAGLTGGQGPGSGGRTGRSAQRPLSQSS